MNDENDRKIDEILHKMEFPGESADRISKYLADKDFVGSVMTRIESENRTPNQSVFWAVFTLCDLCLIVILGTNGHFIKDYFQFDSSSTLA